MELNVNMLVKDLPEPKEFASIEEENDHSRLWAQFINDDTQDAPEWWWKLTEAIEKSGVNYEAIDSALEIIESFPSWPTNQQCQQVIDEMVAEEKLLEYGVLKNWLYADRRRFSYIEESLNKSNKTDDGPMNATELLRNAYEECIRDTISTIEVMFDRYELPEYIIEDDD